MSQAYGKWWLDSCAAITRASYPPFVLRGGLWAPIVRGGVVVRGAGMGLGHGVLAWLPMCKAHSN